MELVRRPTRSARSGPGRQGPLPSAAIAPNRDDNPGPPTHPRLRSPGLGLLIVGVTLALGVLVAAREGSLGWDDADYLRDGLRVAAQIRASATTRPGLALDAILDVRPKPPLLVAWIAAGGLITGGRSPVPLIVFASVVPFALLMGAVAATGRRLFGRRAAWFSTLILVASPMCLSFGAKVMVETFMALWVLLAYASAARLLERPARGPALGLGAAIGLALMTKLTVVLLLPVPALAFSIAFARRHGTGRAAGRALAGILGPILAIALPWYWLNGAAAARFAAFSSRYNVLALGESGGPSRIHRLALIAQDLAGWPLLATIGLAATVVVVRHRTPAGAIAPRAFAGIAALGLVSGAILLLVPDYFDSRFLLPVWPSIAVCLGPVLGAAVTRWTDPRAWACSLLLGISLFLSVDRLRHEPGSETFWGVRDLIDRLVADHGVKNIYNVGNTRNWNVSKTGLANELRAGAGDCFVLHDLSGKEPEEIVRGLAGADAVVALDRSRIPAGWFDYGPRLNRGCLDAIVYLGLSPEFRRVESIPTEGLPPLLVFVRRR